MVLRTSFGKDDKELLAVVTDDPRVAAQIGVKAALSIMQRKAQEARKSMLSKLRDPAFKNAFLGDKIAYWTLMGSIIVLPSYALNHKVNMVFFGMAFIIGCVMGYRIDVIFQKIFGGKAHDKARGFLNAWTPYQSHASYRRQGDSVVVELDSEMSEVLTQMIGDREEASRELGQETRRMINTLVMRIEAPFTKQAFWMGVWLGIVSIMWMIGVWLQS